jgi:hypothetical protein
MPAEFGDSITDIRRLRDQRHVSLRLQNGAQSFAEDGVILDSKDSDGRR